MTKQAQYSNNTIVPDEVVINKIYYIRGHKIMLDNDLAELYGVTTGNLNKAVKRNLKRFPDDFMFQLSQEEFKNLIFQNGTSSWGGTRKVPYAFTEQGVAMLSGILNSDRAIAVNIQIMRIFTKVRQMLSDNTDIKLEIADIKHAITKLAHKQGNQDKNIDLLFTYIDRLQEKIEEPEPAKRKSIGYKIGEKKGKG